MYNGDVILKYNFNAVLTLTERGRIARGLEIKSPAHWTSKIKTH